MLRRMWTALSGPSLRRDRGAQHTEAGVLIATLALLGGAMVVAAPTVGEATSNFWVCEIQGSAAAQCDGDSTTTPRRGALEDDAVQVDDEGSTDSAASHEPGQVTPDEKLTAGTWTLPGGDTRMSRCDRWTPTGYLCTAPDGTVWSCYKSSSSIKGQCGSTQIQTYPMTCSNEGTSPETRLCRTKNGGIYHCTNTTVKDRLSCRGTDNDSDAEMPDGAMPVACGDDNSAEGSVTCIGSNGTLYQCPHGAAYGSDCKGGGRNINREDVSLSDCVAVPQYGEDAVQCTYTATDRECPAESAGSCQLPQRQTSVLCHDDPAGTPDRAYQHCQDLGQIADPDDKVEGICLDPGSTAVAVTGGDDGVCDAAGSVVRTDDLPQESGEPVDFGDFSVSLPADQTTEITLPDGTTRSLTQPQLEAWCEAEEAACAAEMDRQTGAATDALYGALEQAGICDTDAACETFVQGDPTTPGRGLLSARTKKFAAVLLSAGMGTGALIAAVQLPTNPQKLAVGAPLAFAAPFAGYMISAMRRLATQQGRANLRAATIAAAGWATGLAQQLVAAVRSGQDVPGVDGLQEAAEEGASLVGVTLLEQMIELQGGAGGG